MSRSEWSGFYYDGRSAERVPVTLFVTGDGLRILKADGGAMVWPFASLRQTQGRHEREQLRIERSSDPAEALVVNEPGLAEAIRAASGGGGTTLRERTRTARVLTWSFAGLAAFGLFYVWGAPAAADWAARRVPPGWEAELGRGVAGRVTASARVCANPAASAGLRLVLDRLLAAQEETPYEFRLVVLDDSTVNAFAAPGGFIAVHQGLLAATQSAEEFAGVLAHEITHITQRHSTRAILREVPVRFAMSALSGGGGFETATMIAGSMGMLRYRRADESEADREGLRLLHAAQVDAAGIVSFMRTLEKRRESEPRFANYLSSHPRTVDRIAQLEALNRAGTHQVRPLLDAATWEVVQRACDQS